MLRTLILSLIVSIFYFHVRAQDFLSTSNDFSVHAITSIQSSQDDYADLAFLKETLKVKEVRGTGLIHMDIISCNYTRKLMANIF